MFLAENNANSAKCFYFLNTICVFSVIIPGFLPFTLWAALRAFKNFPEIFVAAKIIYYPFAVMCRTCHYSFGGRSPPYACSFRLTAYGLIYLATRHLSLAPVPPHPSLPSTRVDHNIGAYITRKIIKAAIHNNWEIPIQ